MKTKNDELNKKGIVVNQSNQNPRNTRKTTVRIDKSIDYKKQGKRNKVMGADFERRTRVDLESKGWVLSKWQNNIETGNDKKGWLVKDLWKCAPAKPGRFRMIQTGFPDFIAYKLKDIAYEGFMPYEVIFVECKTNGYLSKIEKEKAIWYLKNNYCSKFLVASKYKEKNRVKINYKEFKI